MTQPKSPFRHFNSSPEIIRLVVMIYVKHPLLLRNVEDRLSERGIGICCGDVLESLVTKSRHKAAALNFIKKVMKRHRSPEVIVTDDLSSYAAALREVGTLGKQVKGRRLDNRVENSHPPLRRRERAMLRFRRMKTLQKFTSVHASVHNPFQQNRHLNTRQNDKDRRSAALAEWKSLLA
jgi:putative transposase